MTLICNYYYFPGGDAISMDCDCTDRAAIDSLFRTVVETMGGIDIAVSVVGGGDREPFLKQSIESHLRCIELSQTSHWHFQQSATREMVASGTKNGRCLLIGSIMSNMSVMNACSYQVSKSSLPTLTKCMANELAEHGIRVNLIQPGYIETPGELRWADQVVSSPHMFAIKTLF